MRRPQNKSKKNYMNGVYMNGGGCGCGASHNSSSTMGTFFTGGSASGCNPNPPSFSGVPIHSFYGAANQNENPFDMQVASRLVGGGRKKRKSQKKRKSIKKRRGGGILMSSEPRFTLLNTNTMV